MTAEEAIALIRSMDPVEVDRLITLLKNYEAELRRHGSPADFKNLSAKPAVPETELLTRLNAMELREREVQSNME